MPQVDQILADNLPALRAFMRLRVGPAVAARESTSDLVQSVCREVLEGRDNYEHQGDAAFKSWLFTTALRKIIEKNRFHRAQKRDLGREASDCLGYGGRDDREARSPLDGHATLATPSQDVAMHEQMQEIERAFEQLPEEHREVITLARIAGLPHSEVARSMNITESYSRQLLRRALIRLTRILETSVYG